MKVTKKEWNIIEAFLEDLKLLEIIKALFPSMTDQNYAGITKFIEANFTILMQFIPETLDKDKVEAFALT